MTRFASFLKHFLDAKARHVGPTTERHMPQMKDRELLHWND